MDKVIKLTLGLRSVKEGYHEEVTPDDPDLAAKLAAAGFESEDPIEGAALLSSVTHFRPLEGPRTLEVGFPEEITLLEALATLSGPRGVLQSWADVDGDGRPDVAWVIAEDPEDARAVRLAGVVAAALECAEAAPPDLEESWWTASGPPGFGPDGEIAKPKKRSS